MQPKTTGTCDQLAAHLSPIVTPSAIRLLSGLTTSSGDLSPSTAIFNVSGLQSNVALMTTNSICSTIDEATSTTTISSGRTLGLSLEASNSNTITPVASRSQNSVVRSLVGTPISKGLLLPIPSIATATTAPLTSPLCSYTSSPTSTASTLLASISSPFASELLTSLSLANQLASSATSYPYSSCLSCSTSTTTTTPSSSFSTSFASLIPFPIRGDGDSLGTASGSLFSSDLLSAAATVAAAAATAGQTYPKLDLLSPTSRQMEAEARAIAGSMPIKVVAPEADPNQANMVIAARSGCEMLGKSYGHYRLS
ncbi:unnamed protein product [Protopolystoma xenopodis]|uniref:Uncharacterized protein n=1 Tax=Protopolystoma xenopodis TaxID=117903 RepID=A0A448WDJ5_9PLAT|nr:unnamed protein product [Protopolystoma xenopodis]